LEKLEMDQIFHFGHQFEFDLILIEMSF
jgi:hypothetical protein